MEFKWHLVIPKICQYFKANTLVGARSVKKLVALLTLSDGARIKICPNIARISVNMGVAQLERLDDRDGEGERR